MNKVQYKALSKDYLKIKTTSLIRPYSKGPVLSFTLYFSLIVTPPSCYDQFSSDQVVILLMLLLLFRDDHA